MNTVDARLSFKAAVGKLYMSNHRTSMNVGCDSVFIGRTPIVAQKDTIADLAPAQGPIVADLTVGPTVENAGAGAIAGHQCPTAAGIAAIV